MPWPARTASFVDDYRYVFSSKIKSDFSAMPSFNSRALLLLTLALLATARSAHAAESYGNCTGLISSLPTVINSPGTWCFKQNLSTSITSGSAITVNANNVVIDGNDFALSGLSAGAATQARGINVFSNNSVTIRHCHIRGFFIGTFFNDFAGSRHLVEDNRFDGNTYTALQVAGDGSVVRRNLVFDTGGTTAFANYTATGITVRNGVDVLDNTISGLSVVSGSLGWAEGMYVATPAGGTISGNRISGLVPGVVGLQRGLAIGIYANDAGPLTVRDNDLVGDGSADSIGIVCADGSGLAKDNMMKGFATGISVCSNEGGNVVKP
jgi:hypothetical protein